MKHKPRYLQRVKKFVDGWQTINTARAVNNAKLNQIWSCVICLTYGTSDFNGLLSFIENPMNFCADLSRGGKVLQTFLYHYYFTRFDYNIKWTVKCSLRVLRHYRKLSKTQWFPLIDLCSIVIGCLSLFLYLSHIYKLLICI